MRSNSRNVAPTAAGNWTLTCATADGASHQVDVLVDRGQQVDVGDACGAPAAGRASGQQQREEALSRRPAKSPRNGS